MHRLIGWLIAILWCVWCLYRALPASPPSSPEGSVLLSGVVSEMVCRDDDRCQFALTSAAIDDTSLGATIVLHTDGDPQGQFQVGDVVRTSAFVRSERLDTNPGYAATFSPPRLRWRAWQTPGARLYGEAGQRPWRLTNEALTLLTSDAHALFEAMLLGQRRLLSLEQREAFIDTGTAHLLAISGLHLAVIGWGLFRLMLRLLAAFGGWAQTRGLTPFAATLSLTLVWCYVLGIEASPATQRAALLLSFLFLAFLFSRTLRPTRALVLSALALLSYDPTLALGASFQLSFAAVGALIAVKPLITACEARLNEPGCLQGPIWRGVGRWLVRAMMASMATSAATAPLAVAWFGHFTPWGVLFNLAAVPLTSLLLVPLGMLWFLLAQVSPVLAEPFAVIPEFLATSLLGLVEIWAHWTGPSHVSAWPHLAGVCGALSVVMVIAGARLRRLGLVMACVTGAALVIFSGSPGGVRLVALDVGHGDALVVEGPDGQVALVDTGGSVHEVGNAYLATRTLIPALTRLGHHRLDALVLTHADMDHVGAAKKLLNRIDVSELWLPRCALSVPRVAELASRIDAQGGRLRLLERGDVIRWGALSWNVLWPEPDLECAWGHNETGLAFRVDYADRRILLTADLGHPSEAALLREPDTLRSDILKVGHHGSRGSSGDAFLDAVHPELALVSGRYVGGRMPPHQDVLQRLCRRGVVLKVTGREGALSVTISPEGKITDGGTRPP